MATYHLTSPFQKEAIEALRAGDVVYVSGEAFTCRSRLHRYVFDEGNPSPGAAVSRDLLIHVGPIVIRDEKGDWKLISFMPTSSIRFEKWGADSVKAWGLRMIIGKTTMGEKTMAAMQEEKCVHVSPQSVSPNAWVDHIKIEGVEYFRELGSIEATWHMKLTDLGPFVVDMDKLGNNLYRAHEPVVDENRKNALRKLGIEEDFQYTKLY
ncbi:MAG: fumarate hydratase C-terminal domain-containing protein [Lachnospiraceae bacterium]|nr:fumarate hydratase C-terminal domain-containing protein [Lachnospiraceae bacterium]